MNSWQLWTVSICFVVYALFVLLMAFLSPLYRSFFVKGAGIYTNIIWLVMLSIIWGVGSIKSIYCLTNSSDAKLCISTLIVIVAVLITLTIITTSIIADIMYRSKMKKDAQKKSIST